MAEYQKKSNYKLEAQRVFDVFLRAVEEVPSHLLKSFQEKNNFDSININSTDYFSEVVSKFYNVEDANIYPLNCRNFWKFLDLLNPKIDMVSPILNQLLKKMGCDNPEKIFIDGKTLAGLSNIIGVELVKDILINQTEVFKSLEPKARRNLIDFLLPLPANHFVEEFKNLQRSRYAELYLEISNSQAVLNEFDKDFQNFLNHIELMLTLSRYVACDSDMVINPIIPIYQFAIVTKHQGETLTLNSIYRFMNIE